MELILGNSIRMVLLSISKGKLGFENKVVTVHDVKYPRIHDLLERLKLSRLS